MKTIALTAAALFVAAGSAFAASDHFQAPADHGTSIDSTYTSSVNSSASSSAVVGHPATDTAAQNSRTHWGNN